MFMHLVSLIFAVVRDVQHGGWSVLVHDPRGAQTIRGCPIDQRAERHVVRRCQDTRDPTRMCGYILRWLGMRGL